MRISEWLQLKSDSHVIQSAEPMKILFEKETGFTPDNWPVHTVKETREQIKRDPRGGSINNIDDNKTVIYGYELAKHLAWQYAGKASHKMGRGFAFHENIQILRDAGY